MDGCILLRVCFSALERRACFLCRVDPFLACGKFYAQAPPTDAWSKVNLVVLVRV